jgi:N-methylhydantoinase A
MAILIGVDKGGTFTDLAAYDAGTGRIHYTKSLSTHARPLDGIMACVDKVGIDLGEAALFRHGTTLVINTLLAGLMATGSRDARRYRLKGLKLEIL